MQKITLSKARQAFRKNPSWRTIMVLIDSVIDEELKSRFYIYLAEIIINRTLRSIEISIKRNHKLSDLINDYRQIRELSLSLNKYVKPGDPIIKIEHYDDRLADITSKLNKIPINLNQWS